jgi:hypothetical protein
MFYSAEMALSSVCIRDFCRLKEKILQRLFELYDCISMEMMLERVLSYDKSMLRATARIGIKRKNG